MGGHGVGGRNVPPEGFTALFNGNDFTGRRPAAASPSRTKPGPSGKSIGRWKAASSSSTARVPNCGPAQKYKDFVLLVDWRLPGPGDSGIYLRGQGKSQVNIWCSPLGSGEVWGYRTDKPSPRKSRRPARR